MTDDEIRKDLTNLILDRSKEKGYSTIDLLTFCSNFIGVGFDQLGVTEEIMDQALLRIKKLFIESRIYSNEKKAKKEKEI